MFGEICKGKDFKTLTAMKSRICIFVLFFVGYLGAHLGFAQEKNPTVLNTDSLLQEAIQARKVNDLKKAISLSKQAIAAAPQYYDFHILLGSIYNEMGEPDSAIYYFNFAKQQPAYVQDAEAGIRIAEGIRIENQVDESKLFADPNRHLQGATDLLNRIGVQYLPVLSEQSKFHLWSMEYVRRGPKGKNTVIGRLNYGTRNGRQGIQIDIEDYFVHSKRNYSLFNVAYSPSDILPRLRLGYSLYTGFAQAWEMETGARFHISDGQHIYTAVLGASKEVGNNWINLKNYLTKNGENWYASHLLTWRHYLNENRDYLTVLAGIGTSPDLKNYQFSASGYRDKSIGAGYQGLISTNFQIGFTGVYNHVLVGEQYRNRYDLYASIFYLF